MPKFDRDSHDRWYENIPCVLYTAKHSEPAALFLNSIVVVIRVRYCLNSLNPLHRILDENYRN